MNPIFPIDVKHLWSKVSNLEAKEQIAKNLVERATDGQVIGFGSGTTSMVCALAFGDAIKQGLDISAVVTSYELQWLCQRTGIKVLSLLDTNIDWCFDGADEVDPAGNLLKGRGGAMHRERQVFDSAKVRFVVADSSKDVKVLGEKFAAPLEVDPQQITHVLDALLDMSFDSVDIRTGSGKDGPVITESGNIIIDVSHKPGFTKEISQELDNLDGVIDTGLFMGYEYERIM